MRSDLSLIVFAALTLTGCDLTKMVDSKVQSTAQQYFPLAQVTHPRQDVLQINTHVGNISEKFAAIVMTQLVRDNMQELELALPAANISFLGIVFNEGACSWSPQTTQIRCLPIPTQPGQQAHLYPVYGKIE